MRRAQARRSARPLIAVGLVFTLLAATLAARPPLLVTALEGRVFDLFLRIAPHRAPGTVPFVVDIDEESLARYGQWPWPRYRVAELLDRVRDLGAAAVGVDLVFAEPDRTSLPLLAREVERDLGVRIPPESLGAPRTDNDRTLAAVLAQGPFVLGYAFAFQGERPSEGCVLHPLALDLAPRIKAGDSGVHLAPSVVCNIPLLAQAAGASGFFNVAPDADGTIRRIPLLMGYRGELYPSLALALMMRAGGSTRMAVALGSDGRPVVKAGGAAIPLDGRGNMLLHYRGGRGLFEHVSAEAVLDGRVPAGSLGGRIAIVGSSATGLKELRATPFDPAYPGPEIHATALDTMLQGDFLARPFAVRGMELLAGLLLGFLATLLFARARPRWGLPILVAGSAALWAGAFLLFARAGIFASPLVPQTILAGTFALVVSLRFVREERDAAEFARKLSLTQDVIIQSMAALAETRDQETGGHIQRTRHYVRKLAERLREHPRFREFLDPPTIELLFKLAPLHDIGKVGVRDHILLKPTRLTAEEYEEMKRHTVYGDDTLELAERNLGDDSFLQIAREFALTHQEKWDGTGYPEGLAGDRIPIAGRLMALADVYDALVSRRIYKEPMSHEAAAAVIAAGRGTHFDPDVVDGFLACQGEFEAIAARFADRP